MNIRQCLKELVSLLYWTMLAASTIGPGTVVTCARAGAEYDLDLIWALLFASILAYVLQEGTARLTIVSGMSLGECLQEKYSGLPRLCNFIVLSWIVAIAIFVGNTLFECNNFAGGISAVYSLPPANATTLTRLLGCLGYAIVVVILLLRRKVNFLGIGLGVVMISMVVLFLAVVLKLGVDFEKFLKGLIPLSMPSGSANIVLSLVGTTALTFNIFLGGEMAKDRTLSEARRGIAFSTLMALIVSVLILIVGSGTNIGNNNKNDSKNNNNNKSNNNRFTIASLTGLITTLTGSTGIWVFGLGFIAAALSSMLTAPLSAALTIESVFVTKSSQDHTEESPEGISNDQPEHIRLIISKSRRPEPQYQSLSNQKVHPDSNDQSTRNRLPARYFNSVIIIMVLVSAGVIASNVSATQVILVAQVINGCLLPFFSVCLLLCLNDENLMRKSPQKGIMNVCLISAVFVTMFLTANTIIENVFDWLLVLDVVTSYSSFELVKFVVSVVVSVVAMVAVFWLTDLAKRVRRSFQEFL